MALGKDWTGRTFVDSISNDQNHHQADPHEENIQGGQTRRDFIRGLLVKFGYAAPVIATFSVASVAEAHHKVSHNPTGNMMMSGGGDGMGWLGHSRIAMTMEVYSHLMTDSADRAIKGHLSGFGGL